VLFTQSTRSDPLRVLDLCMLSRAAGLQLLWFFANHRTMLERVVWPGPPVGALLYLLPEQSYKVQWGLDCLRPAATRQEFRPSYSLRYTTRCCRGITGA
jgi:predicted acetyltransferase